MTAIYKKELRSLMTNMTGAIAAASALLVTGLMFRYYNLFNGLLTLHYAVSGSMLLFYIVIPVLSMRSFAVERSQKTDQLLLTSPVRISSIVFGKYLALVTVFAIPVLMMCIYPLIMLSFGAETLLWDYVCIFAFFLMGCAYLAVGMFISSCTESAVISAILTILFIFATQMLSSLFTMISGTAFTAMLFLLVLSVAAALLVYGMTKHFGLSMLTLGVLGAGCIIAYMLRPDFFSGRTESVLRILDFSTHFSDFAGGVFSWTNVLFFLSYAAVGIALTIQSLDKRRWS